MTFGSHADRFLDNLSLICKVVTCMRWTGLTWAHSTARLRGRAATQRSKKGSEKVLGRVLGRVLGKGSEKGGSAMGFAVKKGSEKGSQKGF